MRTFRKFRISHTQKPFNELGSFIFQDILNVEMSTLAFNESIDFGFRDK